MNSIKLLFLLMMLASFATEAALVSTVHKDTSNALEISWEWDGESPSVSKPIFSNWYKEVELVIDLSTSASGFIGHLNITDSTNPFSILAPLLILGDSSTYGTLSDLDFTYLSVNYHFLFDRNIDPLNSTIQLTAAVVPIPSAFLLFTSVILPLLIKLKYHRRKTGGSYNITTLA